MFNKPYLKYKNYNLEPEDKAFLFKAYPETQKMFQEIEKIRNENSKIDDLFNNKATALSEKDSQDLLRIITLQNELLIRERNLFEKKGSRTILQYMKQLEDWKNEDEENS